MPDDHLNDQTFQPLSKEELQSEANSILTTLRSTQGEAYIQAVANLWATEEDVRRYLIIGAEKRSSRYHDILNSKANIEAMQNSQINYLVFYSLSDFELNGILQTIPECKAREMGFKNLDHQLELVENALTRYLELSKHHYYSTFGNILWEGLISRKNRYSILRDPSYVGPEGDFTPEAKKIFRIELMDCSFRDIKHVIRGLEEGEQKLLDFVYVSGNIGEI